MDYQVIVIGAGHAGIEASVCCARLGLKTLMITQNLDTIGRLSCNPSIGGLAKGNMVCEIDALGGQMGQLIDQSMLQFRVLNRSRGPAVQAPRAQADKTLYQSLAKQLLENTPHLYLFQDTVIELLSDAQGHCQGVKTIRGHSISAPAVVLTTGTFLEGKIFIGSYQVEQGRLEEPAVLHLGQFLQKKGFDLGRLKTGTPARVARESLNFEALEEQFSEKDIVPFSMHTPKNFKRPALSCYITYTNQKTHQIIYDNIHLSATCSGKVQGVAPRYCPSIEDKLIRFPQNDRHQIFIEPEGQNTTEMYLNGISTSLPESVQEQFIHSIAGLEKAWIMRPAYAVEYTYLNPQDLQLTLESKIMPGLFIAGQTNGSSGYEEAAAQGLIAGINAARKVQNQAPFLLSRSESYIGVLIDDLVTKGTKEPYRMFTSRAEHRLNLRYNNVDTRLLEKGYQLGLVDEKYYQAYLQKQEKVQQLKQDLQQRFLKAAEAKQYFLDSHEGKSFAQILKDPKIQFEHLRCIDQTLLGGYDSQIEKQLELDIKYQGYIQRQQQQIRSEQALEKIFIPSDFDYSTLISLSNESKEKLSTIRPMSVAQAKNISGIRASDITLLILYFSKRRYEK